MKKRLLKLWSVLLSICILSANMAAMATATAGGGLSLEILSVQKLEDSYDSDAPDIGEDETRGGDAVAVTVGLRNSVSESVSLTGVAFSLEYDGDYVEVENLDLEKNADLGWNLTAEHPEDSQIISVSGTGAAYEAGADASVYVTRFAFRVLTEAKAGTADFTLSSAAVLDADGNRVEIPVKNRSLNIIEAEKPKQTITKVTLTSESVTIDGTSEITPVQASASDADVEITENVVWSIAPAGKGAEIDPQSGVITLAPTAVGEYTVTAKAAENQETLTGEASATLTVTNTLAVITITFDANGGSGSMNDIAIEQGEKLTLPANGFTAPEGAQFKAWDVSGVEYQPDAQIDIVGDTTVKAIWETSAASPQIVITFNANGGVVSVPSMTVMPGELVTLPVATQEGSTFIGWFTAPEGGTAVGDSAAFTENTTLYAHWQGKTTPTPTPGGGGGTSPGGGGSGGGGSSSGGGGGGGSSSSSGSAKTYSITVKTSPNGKIDAPTSAKANSSVSVTVTPNSGYRVKSVSVVKSNGKDVAVKESKGKYTFTMPTTDVTISATFQGTESSGIDIQNDQEEEIVIPTEKSPFSDVSVSALLYNDIKWASDSRLMMGYKDGTYLPNKAISSITAVVVLARMTDSKLTNATSGLWYSNYQTWATQNNILPSGMRMQDTQFSRGEMARLIVSYLKFKGKDCTPPSKRVQFKDADRMLPGEEDAFQYLYAKGVFQGTDTLTMTPRGHVTRAQFAALIRRLSRV